MRGVLLLFIVWLLLFGVSCEPLSMSPVMAQPTEYSVRLEAQSIGMILLMKSDKLGKVIEGDVVSDEAVFDLVKDQFTTHENWHREGLALDAWGNAYHLKIDRGRNVAILYSNGPNQIDDDAKRDDISYEFRLLF